MRPQSVFSHHMLKLEINKTVINRKCVSVWKLSSTVLNNPQIKDKNQKEGKTYLELNDKESRLYQHC